MSKERDTLDVLTRLATEAEASIVVQFLAEQGIAARTVGEFTSGFKAEAPGDVSVLVRHRDLASARSALLTVQQELFAREATATEEDEEDDEDEEAEEESASRIEADRRSRWKLVAQLMLIANAGASQLLSSPI